ncbi:FAS1-like dehydratase domain-containing protein [Actinophytocola sp.]|uniref:FAS1-like dehydratase domain-containing protein n=1 Tax=Actinophytocola sp. TaxID=1872138 RepID=UPI003D6B3E65
MDQDTLRTITAAVGSTVYTREPRALDLATINRLREAFLLPEVADRADVHSAWLGQLPRNWCDLSTDNRPEAPLGFDLGQGVNGGARMVVTRPCRVSDVVRVDATLDSVEVKEGRSGTLVLVTVRRRVSDVDGECVRFYRTTVYRAGGDRS